MRMKRLAWIDSCRFWAIFVIMFTHFLAELRPSALSLWETMPGWLFLGGLTGKFSVAFFFVLLGYFASAPARFGLRGYASYGLRRYVHFAFFVLVTGVFYLLGCYAVTWLFHSRDAAATRVISDGFRYNLLYLLRDAFLFEDTYNATLWCLQQLFLASLLCRLLAFLPDGLRPRYRALAALSVMALLLLLNRTYCVWIAIAVLGFLLRALLSHPEGRGRAPRPSLLVLLFALSVACIKVPLAESPLLYALEGLGAFGLLFVLFHCPWAQRLLARPPFPRLGGISMGLFVVHTPVFSLLVSVLRRFVPDGELSPLPLFLLFLAAFGLCVTAARLLHRAYAALDRRLFRERVHS